MSFKIQLLKDVKVLSGDTQEMAGSVKYFLLEWFIKTDTGTTITTNYFVKSIDSIQSEKVSSKKLTQNLKVAKDHFTRGSLGCSRN